MAYGTHQHLVREPVRRSTSPAGLRVGAANDVHEREADRAADEVMRGGVASWLGATEAASVRRKCDACTKDEEKTLRRDAVAHDAGGWSAPPIVGEVLRSAGEPLDESTRGFMEPRFGFDFGRVRIHTNARAASSARAVQARAYTVGRDVVFAAGAYAPSSVGGQRLIAHELAHVVQQGGSARGESSVSGLLQRDPPPIMALPTPVVQAPYFRTEDAIADLQREVRQLASSSPRIDEARWVALEVYNWLDRLVTSKRAEVAFGDTGNWLPRYDICSNARNAAGEMVGELHSTAFERELRGETGPIRGLLDDELAQVEFARDDLKAMEEAVSYELADARTLPDVPSRFSQLTRAQMHVLAWLQAHRSEIASAASRFHVDRRAVAGAVAWEATEQVKASSWRAVGPGKPHVWEFIGASAVEEVELRGYMPAVESGEREALLRSPPTALEYVAAIMGALADRAERVGLQIRNDPGVLTTVYQGWSPSEWDEHLAERALTVGTGPWPRPIVANPMGIWVDEYLPYLEEAVGFTTLEADAIGEARHRASPSGTVLPP